MAFLQETIKLKTRVPYGPLDNFFTFSSICTSFLAISVLASAMAVVYIQHLNRSLHIELQRLHEMRDKLQVEWSQLLLEQGTYGSDVRVERVAKEQLKMIIPKPEQMMMVRPVTRPMVHQ
jgi:cell division protein FtsL